MKHHVLLERLKKLLFKLGYLAEIFLKTNSKIIISNKKKSTTALIANKKMCAFNWKLECLQTFTCHCELYSFLILKDFSDEIVVTLMKVIFTLHGEMRQPLEGLQNSVSQYFLIVHDVTKLCMCTDTSCFYQIFVLESIAFFHKRCHLWYYVMSLFLLFLNVIINIFKLSNI